MKATDLRIGNLINPKVNGIVLEEEIVKVDPSLLMVIDGQVDNKGITFEPMLLTEEWLLKFGMELTDGFSNSRILKVEKHKFDCSNITFSPNEGLLRLSNGEQKGTTLIPHIKYVHQLQNLYFALTGEELTIKD